jgi:hypothetical protein
MDQQAKDKQAVFDHWWGFPLNDDKSPQPSAEMKTAMEELYKLKKSENPHRPVEKICNLLPAGVAFRAQEVRDHFDKYTCRMKPEERLEFIVSHIDGPVNDDEPAAKRRRCR